MSDESQSTNPQEPLIAEPIEAPDPAEAISSEERTMALLAHLSIFLNLITGFLGAGAALLIYLLYKDKSRYVAYQSLQALFFQLIFFFGGSLLVGFFWLVTGLLSLVLVGLVLIPFALILSLLPIGCLVYGIYAAVEAYHGKDFKYWLVGDWTRSTLTN